mgnify:CR=1 FL=1
MSAFAFVTSAFAGALPAGYIALVTRRGRDFATPFQATAGADGYFDYFGARAGPDRRVPPHPSKTS